MANIRIYAPHVSVELHEHHELAGRKELWSVLDILFDEGGGNITTLSLMTGDVWRPDGEPPQVFTPEQAFKLKTALLEIFAGETAATDQKPEDAYMRFDEVCDPPEGASTVPITPPALPPISADFVLSASDAEAVPSRFALPETTSFVLSATNSAGERTEHLVTVTNKPRDAADPKFPDDYPF